MTERSEKIITTFPYHLAKMYEGVRLHETDSDRVRGLISLFEETIRYLSLVGLALYKYHKLIDDKVEIAQKELSRPSIGHWYALLEKVTEALVNVEPKFLQPPLTQGYPRDDSITTTTELLQNMVDMDKTKKIKLTHFLNGIITFRNKKIGHGSLTNFEANQIVAPLEKALKQWLESVTLLTNSHLLYINQVIYERPDFICQGTRLNQGNNLESLRLTLSKGLDSRRMYLHHDNLLVSLYPFLIYNPDRLFLYVFNGLSNQSQPIVCCPYARTTEKMTLDNVVDSDFGGIVTLKSDSVPPVSELGRVTQPIEVSNPGNVKEYTNMLNWYDLIQPHEDIRKGRFDEAVFAADLGDVDSGKAPNDYNDPYLFYKKTYLTAGLKGLLQKAHDKLVQGIGASVVQIKTPFGGGKTHALVALYHYLKNGSKIRELLPPGLGIVQPKRVVINGEHFNPVEGRCSEGVTRYTFWGEMAYQIGGLAGYEYFQANDESRISPGKEKLRDFLAEHQPVILLFDEILEYVNRALDVQVKAKTGVSLGTQTFSFFQELSDAISALPKAMLVVTLPVSRLEDFGDKEEESLARMSKIFGRVESIETPVEGQEVYAVIRRRLFEVESLKQGAMQEVVHGYFQTYQTYRDDLPPKVGDVNYRDKLALAYPFHPDVIDILYEKWSTYPSFQRTRGVLRLLANVIEDLYHREVGIDLILPGDLNLEKSGIRQDFLKHIGGEYEGVVASDIAGHDAKSQILDRGNFSWKHLAERIATAIFFHSFTADDSEKGINLPYVKLAVLRPEIIPALVTEVLQKQANLLWYLNNRGDVYYFAKIPNLNRMVLDKKELYNESYEEELQRVVEKEVGKKFRCYVWPKTSDNIPDNRDLKLLLLHPTDRGEQITSWIERKGQSFREYKNTLFFAVADLTTFTQLREDIKTYLALQDIEKEIKADPKSPLATRQDEIKSRMHNIQREYSYKVRRMYHLIYAGLEPIDLGQPVSGSEDLGSWYWRELTSREKIVEQLHYRMLVNRVLGGKAQVSTQLILDQFYKNPELPSPAGAEVITHTIQLGVKEGAFGLAFANDGQITVNTLRYREPVSLGTIGFEPGIYVVSVAQCEMIREAHRQKEEVAREEQKAPQPEKESKMGGVGADKPPAGQIGDPIVKPPFVSQTPTTYKWLRLVISDIPAGRIADVNRGIFIPLNGTSSTPLTFTLTLEIQSEEGITVDMLENKVKETIRQIGANVIEEKTA